MTFAALSAFLEQGNDEIVVHTFLNLAHADRVAVCSGIEPVEMRFTRLVAIVFPQRASRDSNPKPSDP